jgi:hypothetical protein
MVSRSRIVLDQTIPLNLKNPVRFIGTYVCAGEYTLFAPSDLAFHKFLEKLGGVAEVSQGGVAEVSQGGVAEISQGGVAEISQGGVTEVSQGGVAEVSQGGVAEISQGNVV